MSREIAFDVETTGLDWEGGDRIIELGAVELDNRLPTGRTFRTLVDPERAVSKETVEITGISDADLEGQPLFSSEEVAGALCDFIGDAVIVAHNARFDRSFLNMELERCGRPPYPDARWVDTLDLAQRRFPGSPASLDALCRRFGIPLDSRTYHGALLDSQLLAKVYLELRGGRARAFSFGEAGSAPSGSEASGPNGRAPKRRAARPRPEPLRRDPCPKEAAAHKAFLARISEASGGQLFWERSGD